MTSETRFEQTTELVSEPGNETNTVPWKTRRNDIVHTNLLALKLHRKITSFLVDIQAETAAQNATENASPDSHMRQWSDQVNQYRTTSNLHMKLTHLKTIHGHNQMCKRRNQAAVTTWLQLLIVRHGLQVSNMGENVKHSCLIAVNGQFYPSWLTYRRTCTHNINTTNKN